MPITGVMYHYVRPVEDSKLRYLSVDDFEKQLEFFIQNIGPIITKNQWEDAKLGLPTDGVLLTFDDGLKDHYRYVLPILLKYNYYGIFFICSNPFIQKSGLLVHLTHYLLSLNQNSLLLRYLEENVPSGIFENLTKEPALSAYIGRQGDRDEILVKKLVNYCHSNIELSPIIKSAWDEFSDLSWSDFSKEWYMNKQEIDELLNANLDIGSHSCSHTLLSSLSSDLIDTELNESKSVLENLTGSKINEFCFPFGGKKSYNDKVWGLMKRANYQVAHDVSPREMTSGDFTSKFTLPRFDCNLFPFGTSHSLKADASGSKT
jgi:peptidoglycan/xylan/chitin deacetylase (PgdA/CDA1 family)